MKKLTVFLFFAPLFVTCMNQTPTDTGETIIVPKILWKCAAKQIIPDGIDSVRITVSSPSMPNSLIKTFPYEADTGTITGVPSGINISIKIEGLDSLGQVLYSGTVEVSNISGSRMEIIIEADQVTPFAPANLSAEALSHSKIQLVWSDNSGNEDFFVLLRCDSAGGLFDSITSTTQNGYADTGLLPAKSYQYKVFAHNAAGVSLPSNIATATTMALDGHGPVISIKSHTNPDTVNTQTITLYGTIDDSSGISLFTIGDIIIEPNANQWMKQNFYLAAPSNAIIIKAVDNSPLKNIALDTLAIVYDPTYVDTANHAPVFTVSADSLESRIKAGFTYRKLLTAYDPDTGDTLRYSVSSGLSLAGKDTVVWTPTALTLGPNSFYAIVYDSRNEKDSVSWIITVINADANYPPEFVTAIGQITSTATVGAGYCDTLQAQDDDLSQLLSYSVIAGPPSLTIGTQSGIIAWTPADTGTYYVTSRVTDDSAANDELSWSIRVNPQAFSSGNHAPVFIVIPNQLKSHGIVGLLYKDTVIATDQDAGDIIQYSVVNGPASIDKNTGIVSWVPGMPGNFGITVRATDDSMAFSDISWNVFVADTNHPPAFFSQSSLMCTTATVGSLYKDTVQVNDPDEDNILLTFSNKPAAMAISDSIISWLPTAADIGENLVSITAVDSLGKTDTLAWSIIVADTNHAPVFLSAASTMCSTATVASVYADTLHANDPDNELVTLSFLSQPASMTISDSIISWAPSVADVGSSQISVRALDSRGKSDTVSWVISVSDTNHAPEFSSVPGSMLSSICVSQIYLDTVHAVDTDGDALNFSMITSTAGLFLTDSIMRWTPISSDLGIKNLSIMVSDGKGKQDTLSWSITVDVLTWKKTYGGPNVELAFGIQQTNDSGYVVVGQKGIFGNYDVYLLKIDITGNEVWSKTYGGTSDDIGHSVQQTSDNGFIIAGYTKSFGAGGDDVYLIKTDAGGALVWSKTYGTAGDDKAYSVIQTNDRGYAVAGRKWGAAGGAWLIKTNSSGDSTWSGAYGIGGNLNYCRSIKQTNDGGYILAGYTTYDPGGDNVLLVKTTSSGALSWMKSYNKAGNENGYSVQQSADAGYVIAGYAELPSDGIYLIKTNASGDTLWTKIFGGNSTDRGFSVQQTQDGGYCLAGETYSYGSGQNDFYLVKTDAGGNSSWSKTSGGNQYDYCTGMQQTFDGGYILVGYSNSFSSSNDIYLVKTDNAGIVK